MPPPITAETDRFSLWAVVAGISTAPVQETPAKPIPLDLMTALAAFGLFPVLVRRRLRKHP
jgi:hypothetical protein